MVDSTGDDRRIYLPRQEWTETANETSIWRHSWWVLVSPSSSTGGMVVRSTTQLDLVQFIHQKKRTVVAQSILCYGSTRHSRHWCGDKGLMRSQHDSRRRRWAGRIPRNSHCVMNELFMMEFINSRSKSCEFPLRLFHPMWKTGVQTSNAQ